MTIHDYPPMLGSINEVEAGSPEWAERMGLRLKLAVEHVEKWGIDPLIEEIERALDVKPRAWEVWPSGQPCRTPNRYFEYAAGISVNSLTELIHAYKGEHPLIPRLQAEAAEREGAEEHKGGRGKKTDYNINGFRGGTRAAYLLRRLARERPDILAAYERGEYRSARAAAIAAGFITVPTTLEKLHKLWVKASAEERAEFLAEIQGQHDEPANRLVDG